MDEQQAYWRKNTQLVGALLAVWFTVSFVLGIWLVEPLNNVVVIGFPLGFWVAQQGAIVVFVGLILAYCVGMDRLDAQLKDRTDAGKGE